MSIESSERNFSREAFLGYGLGSALGLVPIVKDFPGVKNLSSKLKQLATQLDLPQTDYEIPRLSYVPDMDNDHSAKDWLKAGAKKYECKLVDTDGKIAHHALLYTGFMYCNCDNKLLQYLYADWLSRRKPRCGDALQTYVRPKIGDEQILRKTDYMIDTAVGANTVDSCEWRDGGPKKICLFEGNGKVWARKDCGVLDYEAFHKISDSEENDDKTTPNLGFKLKWDLLNPPVPNGEGSAVDIDNLYDPKQKTLEVREHFSLGNVSKCDNFYFSAIPPEKDMVKVDKLDHSPYMWDYFALKSLEIPTPGTPTPESPAPGLLLFLAMLGVAGFYKFTERKNKIARAGVNR